MYDASDVDAFSPLQDCSTWRYVFYRMQLNCYYYYAKQRTVKLVWDNNQGGINHVKMCIYWEALCLCSYDVWVKKC